MSRLVGLPGRLHELVAPVLGPRGPPSGLRTVTHPVTQAVKGGLTFAPSGITSVVLGSTDGGPEYAWPAA
jgi:hypothetical protein